MSIDLNVATLKKKGFINIGATTLNKNEIDELSSLSKNAYSMLPNDHADRIQKSQGGEGIRRLPQHNSRISELLDKIFSDDDLKKLLSSVMGDSYKIWGIHFRRSRAGEPGLYLHQDAVGQVSIAISLDDNPSGTGATMFIPSSLWEPVSIKKQGLELSHRLLAPLRFLFTPLSANKGDISIFINRTWHGRLPNNSTRDHDVILIGMFPDMCAYGYEEWSNEYIESISGTEMGRLIEYPEHAYISTDRNDINSLEIKKNIFSLDIENKSVRQRQSQPISLVFSIQLLKIVMWIKKTISPITQLGRRSIRS